MRVYCAIRRDPRGEEFPDLYSVAFTAKGAREAVQKNPSWDQWLRLHPVVRVAPFDFEEIRPQRPRDH